MPAPTDFDVLTGLPSRQRFVAGVEQLLRTSDANQRRVVYGLLDIDSFLVVMNELGWMRGDALLVAVSQVLRSRAPELGLLSRVQKDQFGFAFAGHDDLALDGFATDLSAAVHDILRQLETPAIRRQAQERAAHRRIYNVCPPTGRPLPDGLSATLALVSVAPPSRSSAAALDEAALAALLRGKRSGGGAIVLVAL